MNTEHTEAVQATDPAPTTPGAVMEARRKEIGIKSVAELGRLSGLSRQYLTAVKMDRFTPKLNRARQLAGALRMDVVELFPRLADKVRASETEDSTEVPNS